MAPQVSTYNSAFNATSLGTTFGTNPTAGDSVYVAISMFNAASSTISSVTDNASGGSNTYTAVSGSAAQNTASNNSVVWYQATGIRLPSSGSLVVTESTGAVSQFPGIQAFSFAGTLDVNGIVNNTATGSGTISLTSTVNGDLFLGAMACSGTSSNVSASSWGVQGFASGNPAFLTTASLTSAPAAGAQTWSMTLPTGDTACLSALAIKPSGGGSETVNGAPLLQFSVRGAPSLAIAAKGAPLLKFSVAGNLVQGTQLIQGAPLLKLPTAGTLVEATHLQGDPLLKLPVTGTINVGHPIQGDPLLSFQVRATANEAIALVGAPLLKFGVTANLAAANAETGHPLLTFGAAATLNATGTAMLTVAPIIRLKVTGNLQKFERVSNTEEYRRPRRWFIWP